MPRGDCPIERSGGWPFWRGILRPIARVWDTAQPTRVTLARCSTTGFGRENTGNYASSTDQYPVAIYGRSVDCQDEGPGEPRGPMAAEDDERERTPAGVDERRLGGPAEDCRRRWIGTRVTAAGQELLDRPVRDAYAKIRLPVAHPGRSAGK
jgi:hypothetical protein